MRYSIVTKMPPALVAPCEPTPAGLLPLSLLDRLPAMRSYVYMIHVFRTGEEPARVVREALAKALVPYYPVAGRFATSRDDGELYVDCGAEQLGVWFVEARADCRLDDVGHLECQPLAIPNDQLFPSAPAGVDEDALTFMMQVTNFKCGGFVIGFKCSHVLFDAIGVGQFILAVSELARGLPQPTVKPVWCREAFPGPANFQHEVDRQLARATAPPPPPAFKLEHCTLDIPHDLVNQLKNSFLKQTGKNCSVFDVLTALVWQCRTRAVGLPPDSNLTLNFPANIRQELHKELPAEGGYYGNCVYHIVVEAPSGKIAGAPLFDVVRLISSAKESLPTRFARWLRGDPDEVPLPLSFGYGSMSFTDLRRVGFVRTDYGWGPPEHVVPIFDHPIGMCIFLNSPAPRKGVRMMTHCVVKEQLQAFKDEIKKLV